MRGRSLRGGVRGSWRSSTIAAPVPPPQAMEITETDTVGDPITDMSLIQPASDEVKVNFEEEKDDEVKLRKPHEKTFGGKIKKKKIPGLKNKRIRKFCQPKNAVICLNEIRPGLDYVTEIETGIGKPVCVSVEVDGQKFKGYGPMKVLAKEAAAESALVSFARQPAAPDESSAETETDKIPWAALASFAMYKLFKYWREGNTGEITPPPSFIGRLGGLNPMLGATSTGSVPADSAWQDALNAHLDNTTVVKDLSKEPTGEKATNADPPPKQNPAKKLPANAITMHPAMLLHQMRPGLQYTTVHSTLENKKFFHASAEIDDQTFYGEGPTMRKAKFCLARDAVKVLYNVESSYGCPE